MTPSRASASKSGPSPQPRSASASGPCGSEAARSPGRRSTSKWIAVSVYRSLTRARLRAAGPAVARLALAAAHFEPAPRALERPVSPLHVCAAAEADLERLLRRLAGHAPTLGREEDGYDSPLRRRGREVRQRPAKPRTAVRVRSAPFSLLIAGLRNDGFRRALLVALPIAAPIRRERLGSRDRARPARSGGRPR